MPQLRKLDWFNQSSLTTRFKLRVVQEHPLRQQLSNQISNAVLANAPARENFRSSELRSNPVCFPATYFIYASMPSFSSLRKAPSVLLLALPSRPRFTAL